MDQNIKKDIEAIWDDRSLLKDPIAQNKIREVIEALDKGQIRVAEPQGKDWTVNDWIKKAVVLYFPLQQMETIEAGFTLDWRSCW